MKIISIANQKGGVGKTTTALNVGCGLAELGKEVLLIDLDPQAHLTASLGFDPETLDSGTRYIFQKPNDITSVILRKRNGNNVYLLSADIDLAKTELELVARTGREFILSTALKHITPPLNPDYVIIDCPPSLSILTINALTASDYLIVPVQTEYLATRGFSGLLDTLAVVRERLNPDLVILGVLATMYDSRKVLDREIITHIQGPFRRELFDTRIRKNVSLAEAPSHGMNIFTYKPDSTGAEDYGNLCKEIIGRMEIEDAKTTTRK